MVSDGYNSVLFGSTQQMVNHIWSCVPFRGVANIVLQSIPSSEIEIEQIAFELCYHCTIYQLILLQRINVLTNTK
jgi:hypothetical protein